MTNLYRCPMCEAQVITQDLAGFRCPTCGFAAGNQLSLFRIGTDNTGSIEYIGPFDPQKNAANAHYYHHKNP
jgi:hypothetical protein